MKRKLVTLHLHNKRFTPATATLLKTVADAVEEFNGTPGRYGVDSASPEIRTNDRDIVFLVDNWKY